MAEPPLERDVTPPNCVKNVVGVIEYVLRGEEALGKVELEVRHAPLDELGVVVIENFHVLGGESWKQGLDGGWVSGPLHGKVNSHSHVQGYYPVVVEEPINDLPHPPLVLLHEGGTEVKHHVDHGSLGEEPDGAVAGVGECGGSEVNVVKEETGEDGLAEVRGEGEAVEEFRLILLGLGGSWNVVGGTAELANLVDVLECALPALRVSVVGNDDLLPNRPRYVLLHEQQHRAVKVDSLYEELPPLHILEEVVEGVLDVVAGGEVGKEGVEVAVVGDDGGEEGVEALEEGGESLLEGVLCTG
mmetsp:Transcript_2383/g.4944  ORF Transcript_2383/g.4944 Transcript_2383/m.4944 type:complete len:301 (+) Transcript_2383:2377-3279(+)